MQTLLLSLYPKLWREQYGDEYEALLEDTTLSAGAIFDIVKAACLLRLKAHERALTDLLGLSLYAVSGQVCLDLGLTDNWPLWAPTTPERAVGLIITLAPLAYVLYSRFALLNEQHNRRTRSLMYWAIGSPLTIISTFFVAINCGSFLAIAINGYEGRVSVAAALAAAGVGIVAVKAINMLRGRLLRQFTT